MKQKFHVVKAQRLPSKFYGNKLKQVRPSCSVSRYSSALTQSLLQEVLSAFALISSLDVCSVSIILYAPS